MSKSTSIYKEILEAKVIYDDLIMETVVLEYQISTFLSEEERALMCKLQIPKL